MDRPLSARPRSGLALLSIGLLTLAACSAAPAAPSSSARASNAPAASVPAGSTEPDLGSPGEGGGSSDPGGTSPGSGGGATGSTGGGTGGGSGATTDPGTTTSGSGVVDGPDTPVTNPPGGAVDPGVPSDGSMPIEPEPNLVDVRQTGWDKLSVSADGRTLTVYYWGGTDQCYGLARVDVDRSETIPTVSVFTGTKPAAVGQACIEIAVYYSVSVPLEDPLVGNPGASS